MAEPFTIKNLVSDPFPQSECDLYTTQTWTLHLRCKPGREQRLLDKFLRIGAEILTGEYVGGDSFAEWCEVYNPHTWYRDHGTALHLYFMAPDRTTAIQRARSLCALAGVANPANVNLSTAGDWSQQVDMFDEERTGA